MRVAKDLLTARPNNIVADRLVIMSKSGRDLGGWGLESLAKKIEEAIIDQCSLEEGRRLAADRRSKGKKLLTAENPLYD